MHLTLSAESVALESINSGIRNDWYCVWECVRG